MSYFEITQKLKDLTMTPADWKWLYEYCKKNGNPKSYLEYRMAYQTRENGKHPKCNTTVRSCKYCGCDFECGYNGFCANQRGCV